MRSASTIRRTLAPRRRRGGSTLGALVGVGVLGAVALGWWYTKKSSSRAGEIDPDRVVRVERRDLLDAVTANGRVEPLARVAVMSRASGIVKEIYVEEGDPVKEGQILAELDREQLEAQRAQDLADLESAEARVAAALARVEEARVKLADPEIPFLERETERLEQLFATGDVSVGERDDAVRELAAARYRMAQIEASQPVLEAAVDEARANLASARAALDRSETALREATIRCPIDGVVLVRDKEVGDGVSSILTAGGNATQLMTLGDLSSMYVDARIDEVDLGRIRVGMPAIVTVDAHRGRELEGRVQRIAPAGSVDGNGIVTFEVRVTVEDPDGLLRPDMTADTKLVLDRRESVLALPQRAVRRGKDGSWTVSRVREDAGGERLEEVEVKLGLSDGLMTEILEGVSEGDRVMLPGTPLERGR